MTARTLAISPAHTRAAMTRWLTAGASALVLLGGALGSGMGTAYADAIMQVQVNDGVNQIGVNEELTYTITARNAGDEGSANVILTARINDGGRFVLGSAAQPGPDRFQQGCTVTPETLRCEGGFLDAFQNGTVTVRAIAPAQAGEMRMNVGITRGTNGTTDNDGFVDTPVIVRPDLRVTAVDGPDAVGDSATGSYLVTVRNNGGSTAAGVRLEVRSESLPWDFYQVEVLDSASSFSCSLTETLSFLTPKVTCTGGALSAGESARVRIRARTSNVLGSGAGLIRATIDPLNTVPESNEGNNVRTRAVSYNGGIF